MSVPSLIAVHIEPSNYCCQPSAHINTLRPRQNGRHFPDDILKCMFLDENLWISLRIPLKFLPKVRIDNTLALVQIMAWRRPGDNHYLNQWWFNYWHIYASLGLSELTILKGFRMGLLPEWLLSQWNDMMASSNGNILRVTGLCEGNSPVVGEFPTQWPVTLSFGVFFELCLNHQLSKQARCWWFETPPCSFWRHCNEVIAEGTCRSKKNIFCTNVFGFLSPRNLSKGNQTMTTRLNKFRRLRKVTDDYYNTLM